MDIVELLKQQKTQLEKELKELEHKAFEIKIEQVKRSKVLKRVEKDLLDLNQDATKK